MEQIEYYIKNEVNEGNRHIAQAFSGLELDSDSYRDFARKLFTEKFLSMETKLSEYPLTAKLCKNLGQTGNRIYFNSHR